MNKVNRFQEYFTEDEIEVLKKAFIELNCAVDDCNTIDFTRMSKELSEIKKFNTMYFINKTTSGTDGRNSITTVVCVCNTYFEALELINNKGYTYAEYGEYFYSDASNRHCMGKITYRIKEKKFSTTL